MRTAILLAFISFISIISSAVPPAMKAARVHAFGPEARIAIEEIPTPAPAAGEILVRVHAAGVNPVDWKIAEGRLKGMSPAPPMTLGQDICGIVESVGEGVTHFKPGEAVMAYLSLRKGGGYAEYAVVPEKDAARKPINIDHEHAAGVPLAALTAWQALIETAELKQGQTVLIHGGAGGVGHFAVQIAKARGARVIATASASNHEFLKSIGADETIDYKTQKFEEVVRDVDVVLDTVGGDTQTRSFGVLNKGGMLVSIVGPPAAEKMQEFGVRGTAILVRPDGAQLEEIRALIEKDSIKPTVSHVFPLDEAAGALEQSRTGHGRGKIVLKMR